MYSKSQDLLELVIMEKNPFQLFAILTTVGIGIYVSYRYVQSLVNDIALTIGIMAVSTVIFFIITFVLYKMGVGRK